MSKTTATNTKLFTKDHEWIQVDGNIATLGITDHAQDTLGDIVFFALPEVGASHSTNDAIATVESVKAASDIYMPAAGTITEVNSTLTETPEVANHSPENEGWICKFKINDIKELENLLSHEQYLEHTQ